MIYTKTITVTSPTTSDAADWIRVQLTDATLLAALNTSGNYLRVRDVGVDVPHKVLSLTSTLCEVLIGLVSPTANTAITLTFVASPESGALPLFDWSPAKIAPPASKLAITTHDGFGIDDTVIHPNILKVPAGSWLANVDGTHVATHVMVNTPLGNNNQVVENPSLYYSTDDGATWSEWNATINPISPYPGDPYYNADPCLAILANGTLRVFYRQKVAGGMAIKYRDVTGTQLSTASVGAEQTATFPDANKPFSPSVMQVSASLWYMFGTDDTVLQVEGKQVLRWTSTDQGATWTSKTAVIKAGGPLSGGGENIAGLWHGGQLVQGWNDWYYCAWSELAPSAGWAFRLYRTRDFTTFEPASQLLMDTAPTWASDHLYTPCLFAKSDGSMGMVFSATTGGATPLPYCGLVSVPLGAGVSVTSALKFGVGRATVSESARTLLACWDFEQAQTLNDLYAAHNIQTDAGSPSLTAGGLYFPSGTNRVKTTDGLMLGGNTELEIEMEFTPTAATGSTQIVLASMKADNTRDFILYITTTGQLYATVWDAGGTALNCRTTGQVFTAGQRYHVWMRLKRSEYFRSWVNGVYTSNAASDAWGASSTIRATSGTQLYIGSYNTASPNPFGGTIHRLAFWGNVIRPYKTTSVGSYCPTYRWTVGSTAVNQMLPFSILTEL